MTLENCVEVIGTSTPANYSALVGGKQFDLFIFKAVAAKHEQSAEKSFAEMMVKPITDVDPQDFYFAELLIGNEPVKKFKIAVADDEGNAAIEAEYHNKMQNIVLPDDLAKQMLADGNMNIFSKEFCE